MKKKALFIFLGLSISLFLSLILAESFCRLFVKVPSVGERIIYSMYEGDIDLKWKLKKSFKVGNITIDSNGFRTYDAKVKDKSAYTVLALGDSHTFGMGVSDEATYPAQLERILTAKLGQPINVINGGVPAYNTAQAFVYYKRIVKEIRPNLVLLGIVADDIQDIYNCLVSSDGNLLKADNPGGFKESSPRSVSIMKYIKRALKEHSYLVRVLTDRIPGLFIKMGLQKSALDEYLVNWSDKELLEKEFQTIKRLKILVERNGGHLILVIFPLADQLIYNRGFDDYQGKLLLFAEDEDIPALDLINAYMPVFAVKRNYSSLFIYNEGHPNENGYRVVAEYIADYIIKNSLISK